MKNKKLTFVDYAHSNTLQVLMPGVHRSTDWRRRKIKEVRNDLGIKYYEYLI